MGLAFSVLQGGIFLAYVVFCAVKVGEVVGKLVGNSFEFFRVVFQFRLKLPGIYTSQDGNVMIDCTFILLSNDIYIYVHCGFVQLF